MPIWIEAEHVRFYKPRTAALSRNEARRLLSEHAPAIRAYGVQRLALAGSVARDEAVVGSDVDVIVDIDLSEGPAARYFGLVEYLEDVLHCEIDLLTRDRIKAHVRASIEADAVPVF